MNDLRNWLNDHKVKNLTKVEAEDHAGLSDKEETC
jgi:hypothetical protein